MNETNTQQLDRIKNETKTKDIADIAHDYILLDLDFWFLIEQAERTQELEDRYDEQLEESQSTYNYFNSEIKRLRAALEFYADKNNYSIWTDTTNNCPTNNVMFDDGYRAYQAIKKEATE